MDKLIKVKDVPDLHRNMESGAVVNTSVDEYNKYIMRKNKIAQEKNRVTKLENDVEEIKNMLQQLMSKL